MGLVDAITRILRRTPSPEIPPPLLEKIVASLVPTKIFTDRSYLDERMLVVEDPGRYFDDCASAVKTAFSTAYGQEHTFQRKPVNYGVEYTMFQDGVRVTYTILRRDLLSDGEDVCSNDITGTLTIEQPHLNLPSAGRFLRGVLKENLLYFNPNQPLQFAVFYQDSTKGIPSEGTMLLSLLDVPVPEKAVMFRGMMGYGKNIMVDVIPLTRLERTL